MEQLEARTVLSGIVLTSVSERADCVYDSFVAPDGDIIAVGFAKYPEGGQDLAVLRYQSNGALDPDFGDGDGIVTTSISRYVNHAYGVAAYANERIMVVGDACESKTQWDVFDVALARYNADGSLDASFGEKGKTAGTVQLDLGGFETSSSVLVQPDGKIIAGGTIISSGTRRFLLVRFTASGQLDASFGVNGVVETSIGSFAELRAITFQDDKILAVGGTNATQRDFALARYNMDGTLDDGGPLDSTPGDSFGTSGIVTSDFVGNDYCEAVAIDAGGRIVVTGHVWKTGIRPSYVVARYSPDGYVDTSFGNGGLVYNDKTFPVAPDHGHACALAIQSDGKIFVAGSSICYDPAEDVHTDAFGLVRYNLDGTLDASFGSGGGVTTPIMDRAYAYSMAIQSDGKLIVSGHADSGYQSYVAMVRYNTDGSLDKDFGGQVNIPPLAVGDLAGTSQDASVTIDVLANDSDYDLADVIQIESFTQGANGSVTDNLDGTVTYTPNSGFSGIDKFTYAISDGNGGTDTGTVAVNVGAVNTAPLAVPDTATTEKNTAVTIDVLYNDNDVDGDPLTVEEVTQGSNGTVAINTADQMVTYTPNVDYLGSDAFSYTISDGNGGTDTATVSVTVIESNDAPVASPDVYTTAEDTDLVVATPGVLDNDSDADGGLLTANLVSNVSNGTLTLDGDGSFVYSPDPDFTGTDTFTYVANDGQDDSNVATVIIAVDPQDDAPVADAGGPYTVLFGGIVTLDASGSSDPDLPDDILSFEWDLDYDGVTFDVDATGVTTTFDAVDLPVDTEVDVAVRVTDSTEPVAMSDIATTTVSVETTPSELIYTSSGDPINIGDNKTVSSSINVAGTGATVGMLTVRINLTHANPGDLTAQIVSSTGRILPIEGPIAADDYAQEYSIEGAAGDPVDGTWTLQVTDNLKNRKRGSLIEWTMIVGPAPLAAAMAAPMGESLPVTSQPLGSSGTTATSSTQDDAIIDDFFVEQSTDPFADPTTDEPVSSASPVDEAFADFDTDPLDDGLLDDLALAAF